MMEPGDFGRNEAAQTRAWLLGAVLTLIVALLLVTVVLAGKRVSAQRDLAQARRQHSFSVVLLTDEVDGAMARAEAALGRAIINTDRTEGSLFYDEWRSAGTKLDALRELVKDNPGQLARIKQLQVLYEKRGEELRAPATRLNYKQNAAALALFGRAGKSKAILATTLLLREVGDAERTLLNARDTDATAKLDQSDSITGALGLVGLLLMVVAVIIGWWLMSALNERRIANEQALAEIDRSMLLERAVAERTEELSTANRLLLEEAATREEAETKLRQIQKMEAVGQLTGGIAHDFNNMLAVVIGGLELAKKRVVEQATEASRHIESAMEGANRAAALTRRLLTFARAEPLMPHAIDCGQLIHGMTDLIDRAIGERIAVRYKDEPGLWAVWIDPYQLENAILNLCVNARDAMAGAGILEIGVANVRVRDGAIGSLKGGDHVRIAVTDTGAGMSAEVLERVFEPFFTTKPLGQGTGLGLSQIFGFARQSGGDVQIQSREGIGTTVSLYLPRHDGVAATPAPAIEDGGADVPTLACGTAILVVEDDDRVRGATGAALRELGYNPILCGAGEEAMALLDARPDIDLLITDVMMPGMTGPELVDRVTARHPRIAVLFVTGYVGEAGEAEQFAGHEVLRKPYTLAGLSASIAAAMTTAKPAETLA